jgi:hypothetical protein
MPPNPIAGAAVGPVAGGITATNAAAINPTGPNVQAATDATMQGSNAAFGALGVPPAPAIAPPQPPVEEPIPAAVNPVNDQPISGPFNPPVRDDWRLGGNAQASAKLTGMPLPDAPEPSPEQWQAVMDMGRRTNGAPRPPGAMGAGGPSFVQQVRNGTAGAPSAYIQRLIADPNVDNSILAEAWEAEYGSPLAMG